MRKTDVSLVREKMEGLSWDENKLMVTRIGVSGSVNKTIVTVINDICVRSGHFIFPLRGPFLEDLFFIFRSNFVSRVGI